MPSQTGAPRPIVPTLPWSDPSDEYLFYEGPMVLVQPGNDDSPASGRVVLLVRSGVSLQWDAVVDAAHPEAAAAWDYVPGQEEVQLRLTIGSHEETIPAVVTGNARGFVQGDRDWVLAAPASTNVVATQFGLPHLFGGEWVTFPDGNEAYRNRLEFEGWTVVLDERKGHREAMSDAVRRRLPLSTHAFDLRRSDGSEFTAVDADDVLTGWNFGVSFAMDRWCPPVLARGYDTDQEICWTEWAPLFIDPPNRGSLRWWNTTRFQDLDSFMRCWMHHWLARDERQARKFLVTSALAAGESAFVEQRLSTRAAALEHFWAFASDRLGAQMAEDLTGGDGKLCRKLRGLLDAAHVDTQIPEHCAALRECADRNAQEHGLFDGPRVVAFVRNRLAHPEQTEQVYAVKGLVSEAARLAGRYLDLLLLWELGYEGHTADRTRIGRWEGDSEPVPWREDNTAEAAR